MRFEDQMLGLYVDCTKSKIIAGMSCSLFRCSHGQGCNRKVQSRGHYMADRLTCSANCCSLGILQLLYLTKKSPTYHILKLLLLILKCKMLN